ncbi:hypothetical protein CFN78_09045 [Amycolatopsis antarctica]|uniref:DUF2063 domain-containing protein n=1 Tax=Amycolatopsis antarctica TaxID=1854586 RepID=A0A263D638_9PSEU|nr:hypothetical protein [Amycolatopsis antarctica]OZM73659.1 hypothetical protein CFN78_09045 [Amycolatopsis antarctica]
MTGTPDLATWQRDISAALLEGAPRDAPADGTPAERSGWAITTALYRQWRVFRLRSVAPLTLAALRDQADVVVAAYLAANPGSTSYAATDAEGFLRFAVRTIPDDVHLAEIAALERDFLTARLPAEVEDPPPPGTLRRACRAGIREARFDPHRLLLWLAGRGEQPEAEPAGLKILVAPGLPGWVRVATADEVELWDSLAAGRAAGSLPAGLGEALGELVRAGAVTASG